MIRFFDEQLPMQLYNARASPEAPLCFPPYAQAHIDELPRTKQALLMLEIPDCQLAAQILGLSALTPNTPVAQHHQQLMHFLGCTMSG
ncbi:hypothetical protein EI94DRAFT_1762942 [Lactarius quietus]|nr:hypothetical protein EI94DRAFT_1762942 [Lactarius quietus]